MSSVAAPSVKRERTAAPRWPTGLRPGGLVFVWAPSSPAPAVYGRRFARALQALEASGYRVVVGESCTTARARPSPRLVAEELHDALGRCDAIVAAVGGWTLLHVLRHLDFERIAHAAKPVVGYSDLTGLLNLLAFRHDLVTFHGPMVLPEWGEAGGPWRYTLRAFQQVLACEWDEIVVEPADEWTDEILWWDRDDSRRRVPRPSGSGEDARVIRAGRGEGRLWGGSVVALGLLTGTRFWPRPRDAIVCLEAEDLAPDEFWTRLEHLRLNGVFETARGVVVGKLARPRATITGYAAFDEVVREVVPPGVPVLGGLDMGHTEPMCCLPIGARARLTCLRGRAELRLAGPADR